jgi:hypothetical protein
MSRFEYRCRSRVQQDRFLSLLIAGRVSRRRRGRFWCAPSARFDIDRGLRNARSDWQWRMLSARVIQRSGVFDGHMYLAHGVSSKEARERAIRERFA